LLAIVVGILIMIVGLIVTLTIVGAVAGVPLMIFGFLLVMRGLF
jgi:hypothetical protein